MPSKPLSKQLVVEGKNDQHVIWNLCLRHNVPENFSVQVAGNDINPEGGIDELLDSIPVRLKMAGLQTLGIVLDADYSAQSRWDAITHRLRESGYNNTAQTPDPLGSIITQERKPTVGIWIMPNNQVPGILEDFVAQLIPQDDPLGQKVESVLTDIESVNLQRYAAVSRPKAFIHTWLSWQERPGQPMGQAITANVLRHDNAIALSFISWLHRLFAN